MSGVDINIAAAALGISLVAFIIALGQIFQQYLATADGYRRCQMSVMGTWAQKTRLRWRWREFRFETLYTTPDIFLVSPKTFRGGEIVILDGSRDSRASSLIPWEHSNVSVNSHSHERACWLPLLYRIHDCFPSLGAAPDELSPFCHRPAIRFQERSWDFQLPDIVRPLATTSVGAIAIIARRLGMRWMDFRPVDGVMRAEGNGQIITATDIRSLGTVIQYIDTWSGFESSRPRPREEYIPVEAADYLGFGRIRHYLGSMNYDLDQYVTVGTRQQVLSTLRTLESSGHCATVLQFIYNEDPDYNLRMGDLAAMLMPMVRVMGTTLVQIPSPSENMLGFSQCAQGRSAFRLCLEAHCNDHEVGDEVQGILQTLKHLNENFKEWDGLGDEPDSDHPEADPARDYRRAHDAMRYRDLLHDHFTVSCTSFSESNSLISMDAHILSAHIRFGIFRENGETSISASRAPDFDSDVRGYFTEWPQILGAILSAHQLWREKGDFPEGLRSLTLTELEKLYFETWITLLFRACCWGACHEFLPGERVPSEWWESQMPIYIG